MAFDWADSDLHNGKTVRKLTYQSCALIQFHKNRSQMVRTIILLILRFANIKTVLYFQNRDYSQNCTRLLILQHSFNVTVGKTSHTARGESASHVHNWWTPACSESKHGCRNMHGELKIWGSHTASVTEVSLLGCCAVSLSKHFLMLQRISAFIFRVTHSSLTAWP